MNIIGVCCLATDDITLAAYDNNTACHMTSISEWDITLGRSCTIEMGELWIVNMCMIKEDETFVDYSLNN